MRISNSIALLLGLAASVGCNGRPPDNAGPAAAEHRRAGKIVLGSPSLTAGIPGHGTLAVAEIRAWLDDPENHKPLDYVLPVSLIDAADSTYIPDDSPLTRAKIELGRQLFFDTRLSGIKSGGTKEAGGFSCAVCHQPDQAYSAHIVMPEVERNAPPTFNRLFSRRQLWDGKAASLEDHPNSPITNPFEMDTTPDECVARIRAIEGYRIQFERVFGEVTFENIGKALAAFQRALVTGPSPWDYHRLLERYKDKDEEALSPTEREVYDEAKAGAARQPMSEAALRGAEVFFGERGRCYLCHTGANLTDELYHNLGAGFENPHEDLGRYKVTGRDEDRGAFKTPSLRNVAKTPPYMHDGSFQTLAQVVDFFDRGGQPNPNLAPEIEPLGLTATEKRDLIEFLDSLTSPLPPVEEGRLPQ